MKIALYDKGNAILQGGIPVYVTADGNRIAFDATTLLARAEKAETALKLWPEFTRSKFAADNLAIPADFVQARFGDSFRIEEGRPVGYDRDGKKIYSRERPGEVASFDEALELMVEGYEHKDAILRNPAAKHPPSQARGDGKSMPRVAFEAMDAKNRMAFMKAGGKIA